MLFEFDGPNRWPDLPGLAYGGPEPSTLIGLRDWLDEAERNAAEVPADPSSLEPQQFFIHNGQIPTASAMLDEAKKFAGAAHTEIDARKAEIDRVRLHYAAVRDEMAQRARASRRKSPAKARFSNEVLRAHAAWLARGKTGEGRLDVEGGFVAGLPLGGLSIQEGRIEKVTLDGAKIDFGHFEGAELIEVTARRTNFAHTKFNRARLESCNFEGAGLVLTDSPGVTIVGGDFRRINADRRAWAAIQMKDVDLREARFADCVLDVARLEGCDLRGADLSRPSDMLKLCSAFNTMFVKCDLRGANFEGRRLHRTNFIDCKFAGVRGNPAIEGPYTVERPDFSPEADGSDVREASAVYALWAASSR